MFAKINDLIELFAVDDRNGDRYANIVRLWLLESNGIGDILIRTLVIFTKIVHFRQE